MSFLLLVVVRILIFLGALGGCIAPIRNLRCKLIVIVADAKSLLATLGLATIIEEQIVGDAII